jgi:hypothetical protein
MPTKRRAEEPAIFRRRSRRPAGVPGRAKPARAFQKNYFFFLAFVFLAAFFTVLAFFAFFAMASSYVG